MPAKKSTINQLLDLNAARERALLLTLEQLRMANRVCDDDARPYILQAIRIIKEVEKDA